MARLRRIPPAVLFVWLLAVVLVPLGAVTPGKAAIFVAFVTVGALFGLTPGGVDGGSSDASPGSGGPGPSV